MYSRLWPLAFVLGAFPMVLLTQGALSSADTRPHSGASSLASQHLVGAGSCAASACHNNNGTKGGTGSEHSFWITRDPHARAYEILFDKRARDIQLRLQRSTAAHEDQRCLSCHVSPDFDVKHPPKEAPYFKTDGVSCESCHGPAKNWLAEHHLESWRRKSAAEKARHGMRDTQSLLGRAQACVKCHVGAPGMDVDHDMIAAGHPRLNFEFAAFHAGMPQHWPSAKDRVAPRGGPDLEARAWVIGQLVSAHAALELLDDRASNKEKGWPEFAEHDCAACHHDLQANNPRQKKGVRTRKPGALAWGNYVTMAPVVLDTFRLQDDPSLQERIDRFQKALADLQLTMDKSAVADRKIVASNARTAAALLKPLLVDLNGKLPARVPMEELFDDILKVRGPKAASSADADTQVHLALAALHHGRHDVNAALSPPELRQALDAMSVRMGLPKGAPVQSASDPDTLRKRLTDFHKLGSARSP